MVRRWSSIVLMALAACGPLPGRTPPAAAPAADASALRVEMPTGAAARFRIEDDPDRPLAASVYSFPSTLVDAGDAKDLLASVRAADPKRLVLALVDEPLATGLGGLAVGPQLRLLRVHGGPYSPWPRDPFSFARATDGAVRVIVRPNVQRTRETDREMGPELVRDLPADVDRAWKGARWALSPVPFHNGQVLLTRDVAWVSMHTVEPRALEILGLPRVPVDTFGTAAGVDRYFAAVEQAARELGALYGRDVRFVHPMPASKMEGVARVELMRRLAGGAGYDLDSLVTLLPSGPSGSGRGSALVADLAAGRQVLAETSAAEWKSFATSYELAEANGARSAIAQAADSSRGAALASFLDLVASRLAAEGFAVSRLPLVIVPDAALATPGSIPQDYFFVTWANVVVERRADGVVRAEGFAGLLPVGDRMARDTFSRAGVHLDLLSPLRASVVRNGGYRCASNHLRATSGGR